MKNVLRLVAFVLVFGCVGLNLDAQQPSAVNNLTLIPAVPPGGVGGACTATTYGYITPTGQVVTCVGSLWVAATTTSGTSTLSGVTLTNGNFSPIADSTTAMQFTKLNGTTDLLVLDTTNGYVGIGNNNVMTAPLHVFRSTNADVAVFQNTNAGNRLKFSVDNSSGAMILQNRNTADSANLPVSLNALGGRVLVGSSTDSGATLNVTGSIAGTTSLSGATHLTATNCTSSAAPAVCASAAAGSVVVAAAGTTVVVNTTAVTANSQIFVMYDSSLGAKLSVTCNATEPALYGVTARTAATSFTITATSPATNPACFSYFIVN